MRLWQQYTKSYTMNTICSFKKKEVRYVYLYIYIYMYIYIYIYVYIYIYIYMCGQAAGWPGAGGLGGWVVVPTNHISNVL